MISALSGRYQNPLYVIPETVEKVILRLNLIYKRLVDPGLRIKEIPTGEPGSPGVEQVLRHNRFNHLLAFLTFRGDAPTRRLERENYVERIRLLLCTTIFARFVPLIVHKAYEGDFLPFEAISIAYNPGGILARGMYFTVTCSEGVPFITHREMITEGRGTFVGEARVRVHMEACREWPKGDVARSFIDPVKSDLSVLILSGELDGSSPPWFGKDAVKYLPNARQIPIRYYGHQIDSPCVSGIMRQFIQNASARGLDASCTAEIRRPPFATEIRRR